MKKEHPNKCQYKASFHYQPFISPCPILPKRPIISLHGTEDMDTTPSRKSQSFCSPIFLAEAFFRLLLKKHFSFLVQRALIFSFKCISISFHLLLYCT